MNINFERLNKITPEINNSIKKNIDSYFTKEGYLFKEVKSKTGYCTCCNTRFNLNDYSYRHNDVAYCPVCNSPLTVKDAGRGRSNLQDYMYFGVFQNLRGGTLLLRTFLCIKDYWGSYENVKTIYEEKYRVYFKNGKRYAFKMSYWGGWYQIDKLPYLELCSLTGIYGIPTKEFDIEYVNPEVVEKNKYFRYSCFSKVTQSISPFNWCRYLELFNKYPVITEKLVKAGFINVIGAKVRRQPLGGYLNYRSNDIRGFLRMNNAELRLLRTLTCDDARYAIQAKSYKLPVSIESISYVKKEYYKYSEIKKYVDCYASLGLNINVDDVVKYLAKQSSDFSLYKDYINWLIKYDFKISKKTLYPKKFLIVHDDMMRYDRRMEAALKEKENKERTEYFQKHILPALCDKLTFSNDKYIVRPFDSVEEMIQEGEVQHICVGGEYYTNAHISGSKVICCLRKATEPNKPYCTIEINNKGCLIQARMEYNQSPPKDVKQFIDKWLAYIKQNKKKKEKKEVA